MNQELEVRDLLLVGCHLGLVAQRENTPENLTASPEERVDNLLIRSEKPESRGRAQHSKAQELPYGLKSTLYVRLGQQVVMILPRAVPIYICLETWSSSLVSRALWGLAQ